MKKLIVSGTVVVLLALAAPGRLAAQVQPTGALQGMTAPKPDVPEIFTLTGEFVRMAYNNEGYVVMGYRMAQEELGKPWVLLNAGLTLRDGVPDFWLKRESISLQTPDGKTVPLATQKEYMADNSLRPLNQRAKVQNDSINYFPAGANRPCPIRFFADLDGPTLSQDSVLLSKDRDCLGRLYFNVPGGIQPGQYWLNVQFASSVVKVPFRVFTKEEEKAFRKQWQDLKKAHDESYK
jgi:hypothetical protein